MQLLPLLRASFIVYWSTSNIVFYRMWRDTADACETCSERDEHGAAQRRGYGLRRRRRRRRRETGSTGGYPSINQCNVVWSVYEHQSSRVVEFFVSHTNQSRKSIETQKVERTLCYFDDNCRVWRIPKMTVPTACNSSRVLRNFSRSGSLVPRAGNRATFGRYPGKYATGVAYHDDNRHRPG